MDGITPEKRGSIEWPEGMTPRVIPPDRLTGTHLRILRILHPISGHRFLPKPWILAHFDKRNSDNFGHELRDLMRKPNEYIYWPDQQNYSLNAGYKHGVYGLTHRGAEQVGVPLPKLRRPEYAHDFGAALVECSLKFGARNAGIAFTMSAPRRYKLSQHEWEPDCHPIAIADIFLPGIEFERRPKGGSPKDTNEKIDKIIEFMKQRLFVQFGFKKALIPIVSTTAARTRELMDKVAERTGGACPFIIFKTTKDWARERHFPPPDGAMFTEPWLRVGHPPLNLKG